jgi:cell division protein FtsQ
MVPKIGNHIIVLGSADDLENKFNKLMIFYNEVLKNFDADDFRIVNLKYKDQIVCSKNML